MSYAVKNDLTGARSVDSAADCIPSEFFSDTIPVLAQTKDEIDAIAARQYAKLVALKNMTPAQVSAWVDANIIDLPTARDALKTLAIAVGILARRI